MYTHPCIKCGVPYQDEDPDAYYCVPCNTERLHIAAELDAKRPKTFEKTPSELEIFDASQKIRGFVIDKQNG